MTTPELKQETTTEDLKDQEVKPQEETEQPKDQEPEDETEKNWRAVREKRKEEERLRKEQAKKIEEQQEMLKAMEALLNKQNAPQQQSSEETSIHPQEWVTGEQLQKILRKQEEENEKLRKQEEQRQMQQRIRSSFPDMDDVLSQDNLAYLEYHEPEIAAGIAQIQDPYLQVANAYKTVKRLVPQMTDQDRKKMERTQNAPSSLSDPKVGGNPSQAAQGNYRPSRMSQQQKRELYEDMIRNSR